MDCVFFRHLQDWCLSPGLTYILCSASPHLSMTTLFVAETSVLCYVPRLMANNLLFIMSTLTASVNAFFLFHQNVCYYLPVHTMQPPPRLTSQIRGALYSDT